jgi:c-di-GMP-binding flagellar brake protein YcgR
VEFLLEDFQEIIKAEAEVVRSNNHNLPDQGRHEYGLRFTSMHPHFREVLERFVELAGS